MNRDLMVGAMLSGLLFASGACSLDQVEAIAAEGTRGLEAEGETPEPPPGAVRHPEDCAKGGRKHGSAACGARPDAGAIPRDGGFENVCNQPYRAPTPLGCERVITETADCRSFETATQRLDEACAAVGLELIDVHQEVTEGCPNDSAKQTAGMCCPADPGGCTYHFAGDGKSCLGPASLNALARSSCEAMDMWHITARAYSDNVCPGGSFSRATYTCCPDDTSPFVRE